MCYMGGQFICNEVIENHFPNTKQGRKDAYLYLVKIGYLDDVPFNFQPTPLNLQDFLYLANRHYQGISIDY